MAQPYMTFNFLDHSGERSKVSMHLPDVTNVNYVATQGVLTDMRIAIQALTLCAMGSQPELVCEVHTDVATIPSSPYAQRETRAMFECAATTGRRFKIGVPCPDLTDMGQSGTDAINMANAEVAAYVAALGLWAVSPENTAFSVIKGKIEGRNV